MSSFPSSSMRKPISTTTQPHSHTTTTDTETEERQREDKRDREKTEIEEAARIRRPLYDISIISSATIASATAALGATPRTRLRTEPAG
jgi:hypothetical protein